MRTALRYVSSVVLLLWASQAVAANWSHFADCGSAERQRTYWYDASSVMSSGPTKRVRIRGDYSHVAGSVAASAEILWSVNCSDRTFSEQRRTERGATGKVVAKYTRATRVADASPGSVASKLIDRVCA